MINEICKRQLQNPDPQLYNESLWEVAKGYCTYYRTNDAFLVSLYACFVSAFSSLLIIYTIHISSTRLSSIYHRIMYATSICEIIYSISAGLGTLPMPAPGDYWTDINNIAGKRMGNVHTCAAQGLFFVLGVEAYFHYYVGLLLYYVCAIGFKMSNETMRRCLEPLIHTVSIVSALVSAIPPFVRGDYNASFSFPVCTSVPKPWFCNNDLNGGVECVRGKNAKIIEFRGKVAGRVLSGCIACLLITCIHVFFSEQRKINVRKILTNDVLYSKIGDRRIRRRGDLSGLRSKDCKSSKSSSSAQQHSINENTTLLSQEALDGTEQNLNSTENEGYTETKSILFQALWYLTSIIPLFLSWMYLNEHQYPSHMAYKSTLFAVSYSQGFTNLLIFISHKVFNLKVSNPEMTTLEAIRDIFESGGIHDPILITEIDLVNEYHSTELSAHDNNDGDSGPKSRKISIENIQQQSSSTTSREEGPSIYFPKIYDEANNRRNADTSMVVGSEGVSSRSSVSLFPASTVVSASSTQLQSNWSHGSVERDEARLNHQLGLIEEQVSYFSTSNNIRGSSEEDISF